MKLNSAQCRPSEKNTSARAGLRIRCKSSFSSSSAPFTVSPLQQRTSTCGQDSLLYRPLSAPEQQFEQASTPFVVSSNFSLTSPSLHKNKLAISRQSSLKLVAPVHGGQKGLLRRSLSCTTIGRKRVLGVEDIDLDFIPSSKKKRFLPVYPSSPSSSSSSSSSCFSYDDDHHANVRNSALESLPFDVLVHIVCCLQHDELQPVFHVSKRFRKAVSIARQIHFNFTTPEKKKKTPQRNSLTQGDQQLDGGDIADEEDDDDKEVPPTPNAPRHGPKTRDGLVCTERLGPFAPPLFQDEENSNAYDDGSEQRHPCVSLIHCSKHYRRRRRSCFNSHLQCLKRRTQSTVATSHRVLFSEEDELCNAVAQHSIHH